MGKRPDKGSCHAVMIVFMTTALLVILAAASQSLQAQDHGRADPLPSWNDGASRKTITDFIGKVTDPRNPSYVAPEDRIAAFDLDGTLIPEKPCYIQIAFMAVSIRAQAENHPEWKEEQPFKAVLENDFDYLGHIRIAEVARLLEASYPGLSIEEYEKKVRAWTGSTPHPRFGFCYRTLIYRPMVELITFLQSSGFKTYICTGSTTEFSRTLCREFFSLPMEQVIGSRMGFEFRDSSGGPEIIKKPQVILLNDRGEKAINMELQLGKRPIMAVGNSNGDIEMFQYTLSRKGPSLAVLIHHDDGDREYCYDRGAEKVLQLVNDKKCIAVSMKKDFKIIFATERLLEKK
jgi:phosphoserine phosphatase